MNKFVERINWGSGITYSPTAMYWASCCGARVVDDIYTEKKHGEILFGVQLNISTQFKAPESTDTVVVDQVVCGDAVITVGSRVKV